MLDSSKSGLVTAQGTGVEQDVYERQENGICSMWQQAKLRNGGW